MLLAEPRVLVHYDVVGSGVRCSRRHLPTAQGQLAFSQQGTGFTTWQPVVAHSKFVIARNDLAIWSYFLCSATTTATLHWRINSRLWLVSASVFLWLLIIHNLVLINLLSHLL